MYFYFYSSLLHLKLIFLPSPSGEKNQVAQLESEGLAKLMYFFLALSHQFLWQVLEHNYRLKLMPLGQMEQALMGDTDKSFL